MATSIMSRGTLYRISAPTVAIVQEDGKPVAQIVPEGSTVNIPDLAAVADDAPQGLGLIEAIWEARTILMFARDVRDRAELVTATGA